MVVLARVARRPRMLTMAASRRTVALLDRVMEAVVVVLRRADDSSTPRDTAVIYTSVHNQHKVVHTG